MIRPQPMLVLDDVEAGSRWFCDVIGVTSGHGGAEYEMLMDGDEIVAQLHLRDAHEHRISATPPTLRTATASCSGSPPTSSTPWSGGRRVRAPRCSSPLSTTAMPHSASYTVVVASLREPRPS